MSGPIWSDERIRVLLARRVAGEGIPPQAMAWILASVAVVRDDYEAKLARATADTEFWVRTAKAIAKEAGGQL